MPQFVVLSCSLPSRCKHSAVSHVSCLAPAAAAVKLTSENTCPQFAFTECLICMRKYLQASLARRTTFHSLENEWKGRDCLTPLGVVHQEPVLHSLTRILGCALSRPLPDFSAWCYRRQSCLWVLGSGCVSHLGIVVIQVQKYVLNAYFVPIPEDYGDNWDRPGSSKRTPFIVGGAIVESPNPNLGDF